MLERLLRVVVPLCLVLLTTTGHAEEGSRVIEEILVTATKRSESLQQVPIAVTALSAAELERAGIKDLRDLSDVVPSFNMNSTQTESQGSTFRIRGVGTTGNNIGLESAVGVFIDGAYVSRPGVALSDLMDIEQIEVLRGPQGTLFGRNTSAGAVTIRTRKPNMQEHEYFANVTAGNFDARNVQLGATGPLVDGKVAYRFSGAYRKHDGFLDSTTGASSVDRDRYSLRGQLQWDFGDTADLRVIVDYAEAKESCCDAVIFVESPAVALGAYAAAGLPADGGVQRSGNSAVDGRDTNSPRFSNPFEQYGLTVEFNVDITDNLTATYLGSWRDFDASSIQPGGFVNLNNFAFSPAVADGFETFDEIETITHEFRLAGETDHLSWMIGGYYLGEEIVEQQGLGLATDYTANSDAVLFNFAFLPLLGAAQGLADIPLATGGTFGDVLAAASPTTAFGGGLTSNGAFAQNRYAQETSSWSLFTHSTLRIHDSLDLVVGLRWTEEKKEGDFRQFDATNPACFNVLANANALSVGAVGTGLEAVAATIGGFSAALACLPFATPADTGIPILPVTFDDTFEDEELVYTGKLVFNPNDELSVYVSFTHGFKSGGFNLDSTAAIGGTDPRFDSEIIDSWEIGLKSEWFDRRLRANIALFDYAIEDFQVLEFTGVQFQTFNVPNAESQGVEVELSAVPLPGLDINLSYTYADSKYPSDCDGNNPNASPTVSSLCGAQFTNAPKNVVTFRAGYEGYFGNAMTYFVAANMRWEDDRRTATQPSVPREIQEANTTVSLRLGVGNVSERWTLELWGNNVTNEISRSVTFNTPLRFGSSGAFLEAPRTYGMTLRTRF